MSEGPDAGVRRHVVDRAVRRLATLEALLLGAAAVAALLAGALVAWLLGVEWGWAFRRTWWVTSLAFFLVPGSFALWRVRREESRGEGGRAGAAQASGEGPRPSEGAADHADDPSSE